MAYSEEKSRHDRLVIEVARIRFVYPTTDHPTYVTYTNEPAQRMGMKTGSSVVYPDIVVVDASASNNIELIGEVETEATINQDHVQQWRSYAGLKVPFYLYVPSPLVQEARRLLSSNGVSLSGGLRFYSNDAQGGLQITNL